MFKRRLLAASALALPVFLGACAATSGNPTVQAVFNAIQYVLPFADALALGISVAVPASASLMAGVMTGLNQAGPIFQTLQNTMTAAAALPIVKQIEDYVSAGVSSIGSVVAANQKLAAYQTRVTQAQTLVGLLTTFVNGVSAGVPVAALAPTVPIPLLHK
jgi:hypothetical protein